jgi:hypothetical protein
MTISPTKRIHLIAIGSLTAYLLLIIVMNYFNPVSFFEWKNWNGVRAVYDFYVRFVLHN